MNLKWSQFVFQVKPKDKKDKIIFRSTLTGATIRMRSKLKRIIDSFLEEEDDDESKYPKKIRDYVNSLTKLGILIPRDTDEKKNYLSLFNDIRNNDSTFGIYLVTTTDCQLRCPYCYEQNINQKQFLNIAMADKIILWCQKYIERNKQCKKLRVILYGGEPLLNKRIIKYILPQLHQTAQRNNLLFDTQIVTNGVLLNPQMALFLARHNLDRIQITIDGPPKIHDKRRIGKNGKGTFDRIFQNILNISSMGIIKKISIRINFDKNNISAIHELLDILALHKLQDKVDLSFGIITLTSCSEPKRKYKKNYIDLYGFSDSENAEKYLWLCKEAKERGFTIPKEFMLGPWCSTRAIHSVVIEPNGSLLKCFSGVGRKEFIFGDINSKFTCNDPRFSDFAYLKECLQKECPYLPICGGGCRFEAFIHQGNIQKPYCQFNLIDKINKGLTRLNYDKK